jgi:molecular chaperone GrpE
MTERKKQPKLDKSGNIKEESTPNEVHEEYLPVEVFESSENKNGMVLTLQQELNETRAKANEYLDGWQRGLAEFANYKKRVEREQAQSYQNAAGNIIKRYLDVVDDLERALKNRPKEGEGVSWADGVELIYRKFLNIIENEGVQPVGKPGEDFDPTLHEAITSEENDQYSSGQIIEVLHQGYILGDRLLRPAMVRVAK